MNTIYVSTDKSAIKHYLSSIMCGRFEYHSSEHIVLVKESFLRNWCSEAPGTIICNDHKRVWFEASVWWGVLGVTMYPVSQLFHLIALRAYLRK